MIEGILNVHGEKNGRSSASSTNNVALGVCPASGADAAKNKFEEKGDIKKEQSKQARYTDYGLFADHECM